MIGGLTLARRSSFNLVLLFLILGLSCSCLALENNIWGNARIAAMGFAQVAGLEDSSSLLANPASLGQSPFSLSISRSELYAIGVFYNYIVGSILFSPNWRLGLCVEFIEDQDLIDNSGFYQQTTAIGIANRINDKLQMGINIRGIQNKLFNEAVGSGRAIDIGLRMSSWQLGKAKFNVGLKLENLISFKQYESGRRESPDRNVQIGVNMDTGNTIYALDLKNDGFSCGLEHKVTSFLALRAGLIDGQPTMGIGIKQGFFRLDYAYWLADVGVTHRFGTTLSL